MFAGGAAALTRTPAAEAGGWSCWQCAGREAEEAQQAEEEASLLLPGVVLLRRRRHRCYPISVVLPRFPLPLPRPDQPLVRQPRFPLPPPRLVVRRSQTRHLWAHRSSFLSSA